MNNNEKSSELAKTKIIKARTSLIQEGRLGMASMIVPLALKEVSESVCSTMATDGKHIFWCEKFVDKCDEKELVFTLVHEALHVTFAHHLRRGKRNPRLWNVACDYCINGELYRSGERFHWKMPKGALYERGYSGQTAEEIYADLEQKQDSSDDKTQGGNQGESGDDANGDGGKNSTGNEKKEGDDLANANDGNPKDFETAGEIWDAVNDDGKPLSENEKVNAERKLNNHVRLSESVDRACGSGASENIFRGRLKDLDLEIADYLSKIQDWLISVFPDETSWNRPHRSHIWRDTTYRSGNYLPSKKPSCMGGTLAIGIDVSGSTTYYLDAFASQVQGLIEQCNIEKVKVCWCSTICYKNEQGEWWDEFDIASGDQLKLEARGGGGTELTPIFNLLNDYTDDVADLQGIIVFTDGYFNPIAEDKEPDIPVLWASTDKIPNSWHTTEPNFGEVVHLPKRCLTDY